MSVITSLNFFRRRISDPATWWVFGLLLTFSLAGDAQQRERTVPQERASSSSRGEVRVLEKRSAVSSATTDKAVLSPERWRDGSYILTLERTAAVGVDTYDENPGSDPGPATARYVAPSLPAVPPGRLQVYWPAREEATEYLLDFTLSSEGTIEYKFNSYYSVSLGDEPQKAAGKLAGSGIRQLLIVANMPGKANAEKIGFSLTLISGKSVEFHSVEVSRLQAD